MNPILYIEFSDVAICRPSAGRLLVGIDTEGFRVSIDARPEMTRLTAAWGSMGSSKTEKDRAYQIVFALDREKLYD